MENSTGRHRQMSETFRLGAILALTGGFLDAYTYLSRGHVFANAETGNIVLLGVQLAQGEFRRAFYYLVPILAYSLGVIVSEAVRQHFSSHPALHWRQVILAAEILLLFCVAFVPQGSWDMAVNTAVSFVSSMQVQAFRKMNGCAYATTMCTGNLRSGTEFLYRFLLTRDTAERHKALQYFGIILFFIAGAALGALLTTLFSIRSVLFCCITLLFAFASMFRREV